MLRIFVFCCVAVLVTSCNPSVEKKEGVQVTIIDGASKYELYQDSEMTALMESMYAYNEQVKSQIQNDSLQLTFPAAFLNIHSAQLSEAKSRTDRFNAYSVKFIEAQKAIFEIDSIRSLESRYNEAIQLCISCHQTECTGPIPRIKKLLIN